MTKMRNIAARMEVEFDHLLLNLSTSYKLAQEAKARGHREDWITLDYVSDLYHDAAGLISRLSSYVNTVEGFTPEEQIRMFSMKHDEWKNTTEFTREED